MLNGVLPESKWQVRIYFPSNVPCPSFLASLLSFSATHSLLLFRTHSRCLLASPDIRIAQWPSRTATGKQKLVLEDDSDEEYTPPAPVKNTPSALAKTTPAKKTHLAPARKDQSGVVNPRVTALLSPERKRRRKDVTTLRQKLHNRYIENYQLRQQLLSVKEATADLTTAADEEEGVSAFRQALQACICCCYFLVSDGSRSHRR